MDILVIDDNAFIIEMIRNILGSEEYIVHSCTNVDDALQAIEAQRFDLIITDIVLPVRSGVDLMRELKRRGIDMPVLAITGGVENAVNDYVDYADLYADETLAKPFKHRDLVAAVDRLGGRGLH